VCLSDAPDVWTDEFVAHLEEIEFTCSVANAVDARLVEKQEFDISAEASGRCGRAHREVGNRSVVLRRYALRRRDADSGAVPVAPTG
jgi:hypothetical protein